MKNLEIIICIFFKKIIHKFLIILCIVEWLIHFFKFEGAILSRILINGTILIFLSWYLFNTIKMVINLNSVFKILIYCLMITGITFIMKNNLGVHFIIEIMLLFIPMMGIFYLFQAKNIKQIITIE